MRRREGCPPHPSLLPRVTWGVLVLRSSDGSNPHVRSCGRVVMATWDVHLSPSLSISLDLCLSLSGCASRTQCKESKGKAGCRVGGRTCTWVGERGGHRGGRKEGGGWGGTRARGREKGRGTGRRERKRGGGRTVGEVQARARKRRETTSEWTKKKVKCVVGEGCETREEDLWTKGDRTEMRR